MQIISRYGIINHKVDKEKNNVTIRNIIENFIEKLRNLYISTLYHKKFDIL